MPGRRAGKGPCRQRRRRGMRLIMQPSLLLLLAESDSHGYDLLDQLEMMGFDPECLDSSMVYRDLRDMEEDGLIVSSWDEEDSKGPRRRVYQINEQGWSQLNRWLKSLEGVKTQIEQLADRHRKLVQTREE